MTTMTLINKVLPGVSHKHVVEDAAGQRWVYKSGPDGINEYLSAAVAHMFGVKAPVVMRTDDTWCVGCDDEGAYIKWASGYTEGEKEQYTLTDDALMVRLEQSVLLACFDAAIGNSDRHVGNWMGAPDGSILAIDNAYGYDSESCTTSNSVNETRLMYQAKSGWSGAFPADHRLSAFVNEAWLEHMTDILMDLASRAPVGVGESLMTFALYLKPFMYRWFQRHDKRTGRALDVPDCLQETVKQNIVAYLDEAMPTVVHGLVGRRVYGKFYGVNDDVVMVWENPYNEKMARVVVWNDDFFRWENGGDFMYLSDNRPFEEDILVAIAYKY
jgi:hypothetical protein